MLTAETRVSAVSVAIAVNTATIAASALIMTKIVLGLNRVFETHRSVYSRWFG